MSRIPRTISTSFVLCLAGCAYWGDEGRPATTGSSTMSSGSKAVAHAALSTSVPTSAAAHGPQVIKLTGSSTIGINLVPKLASAFLANLGANDASVDTSDKSDNKISVTGHVDGQLITFVVSYPGSGAAFECLRGGSCDVGLSSRPIRTDEANQLSSLGDMTSPQAEHVVAMDGIAVVVHRSNRVVKLTIPQIAGIFKGTITNWQDVSGSPGDIHRYIRDEKSGTYDTFIQFVTQGEALPADKSHVMDDNESLANAVARDEGGIGFVGLAFAGAARPVAVEDGDAAPIAPTPFSVGTEDYAFSRRLYLYTPENLSQPLVSRFVDFALSDAGQKVVSEVGFVSLNVNATSPTIPGSAPDAYFKAVNGARRLSFNFRFRTGGTGLDGKALGDLDRMTRYIKATVSTPAVVLLGFADNQGAEPQNLELSKQRAKTVADQLKRRGVDVQIATGFGSALPVAPNATPDGRVRNRRVEVWVK